MKLKTNFVNTPLNLVPLFSIINWGLALGLLILSIYLVLDGNRLQQKNIVLVDQQKKLNDQWLTVSDQSKQQLTRDRFDKLKIRFATINQLTEMTGQDVSLILSRLESLLPDQSYLLSLNYRSNTDELALVIESSDVGKLTDFIESLEKDKLFSDISIVRQDHVSRKGQTAVQFEVHVKSMTSMRGV
jgi:Tfp pilus assembly protein PilN